MKDLMSESISGLFYKDFFYNLLYLIFITALQFYPKYISTLFTNLYKQFYTMSLNKKHRLYIVLRFLTVKPDEVFHLTVHKLFVFTV